jgi:hypothetical protein
MDKYSEQLENIIKQMLKPLKGIPLKLVIESLCNHTILPFDESDPKDKLLLENLIKIMEVAVKNINNVGIQRKRPNEVGNDIEPFIKDALNSFGYTSRTPSTITGHQKTMGYPDIEFIDDFNRTNYLECKTYNIETINTTQRSFYLSPSEDFKITKDAHHFIVSFEVYEESQIGNQNLYKCRGWKILSAEKLLVDVKYEFNSDNARLYQKDLILAEGYI